MSLSAPTSERREHCRKVRPFYVGICTGGESFVPAYGVDVSSGGIGVLATVHAPVGPFRLRVMIENLDFVVTVTSVREAEQTRAGKLWYAMGLRITEIAPEDARAIAALVTEEAQPPAPSGGGRENQRRCRRKRGAFYAAFSLNGALFIPAYGFDVGRDGLCLYSDVKLPEAPFWCRLRLVEREFVAMVKRAWDRPANGARAGWITGACFMQIEPADREFIACYVDGRPFYDGNKLLEALERLRSEPDRADLWLPPELLRAMLERLVRIKRLAPLTARSHPLVRYHYDGSQTEGEHVMHLISIQSRFHEDGLVRRFTTRFSFDESGGNLQVL